MDVAVAAPQLLPPPLHQRHLLPRQPLHQHLHQQHPLLKVARAALKKKTGSTPIQLSDLQNILSGISVPADVAASPKLPVDLSSAMTAEALQPILTNQDFVDQLKPYLPPTATGMAPAEQLKGTVTSPQFQQAVSLLSSALQSGQLGPLINQFGLGEDAVLAATACDMEAFVKALGKRKEGGSSSGSKEEDKTTESGKKDQDKDEDDSMSVD